MSFCCVSAQRYGDKVEHVCTCTNIPLSDDAKIVSEFQGVNGEVA